MAEKIAIGVSKAIDVLGFGKFQSLLSVYSGAAQIADSMEMLLLSILSPALQCSSWRITNTEAAGLTSFVFAGMLLGSPSFGAMADKFGRRPTVIFSTAFLLYFGMLTAIAPNYRWVVFLRFLAGFFIGAIPQTSTLYVEYLPSSIRAKSVMILAVFWAIGASFIALIAWLVMPTLGWRYMVGVATIPLWLLVAASPWCPESPLYYVTTGQKDRALEQIERVARINGVKDFSDKYRIEMADCEVSSKDRGSFYDLFASGRYKLTLLVFAMWFVGAASYYGSVLLGTTLLNSSHGLCSGRGGGGGNASVSAGAAEKHLTCSVGVCEGLQPDDYVGLIWTSLSEFPGVIVAILTVDWLGRKKTMALLYGLYAVAMLLMSGCSLGRDILIPALSLARASSAGAFQVAYVYTPEVYPTNLRAVAMGSGSSFARVGAMLTPFVAQVLIMESVYFAVGTYVAIGVLGCVVAMSLPIESKGTDLSDTGHQVTKGRRRLVEEE